jgi:hypothetical protein
MSNTLAQELQLTIQTLQSSLATLQTLQQKHTSNGSVHLPLYIKTCDLDVRTRLRKLQHDAQFVPELMEKLTTHFEAVTKSVGTTRHSCKPNPSLIGVENDILVAQAMQAIPEGVTKTVDYSKIEVLSNVESMTRFCVACRGPCAQVDWGTDQKEVAVGEVGETHGETIKKEVGESVVAEDG